MKKMLSFLLMAALCCLFAASQELPQFKSGTIEEWTYNNPGVELTSTNVSDGRIVLYVDSEGRVLTLTSPEFTCQGIDSICASVMWFIKSSKLNHPDFNLAKTALTMAIDDAEGHPLDSVTCVPHEKVSTQTLTLTLAVPKGLNQARLRFVSWQADVVSSGAIKRALLTAIAATAPQDATPGDVDGDGHVGMDDLAELINYLLTTNSDGINLQGADVNGSGFVNMDDLSDLINYLLLH